MDSGRYRETIGSSFAIGPADPGQLYYKEEGGAFVAVGSFPIGRFSGQRGGGAAPTYQLPQTPQYMVPSIAHRLDGAGAPHHALQQQELAGQAVAEK